MRSVLNPIDAAWLSVQRRALLQLRALGQRLHPRYVKAPHLLIGERGEFEALFFLRRHGYVIVERRWKSPDLRGDLDLVAWDGPFLAIVEVKTRTARDLTPALSAVDDVKRRVLRDLAVAYRRTIPRSTDGPIPVRFDVVSVYLTGERVECELLPSAFSLRSESRGNAENGYGV
jgi:putative endonuclease